MPMKLTTTIGKVQTIPNPKNIEIVNDFLDYMRKNNFTTLGLFDRIIVFYDRKQDKDLLVLHNLP